MLRSEKFIQSSNRHYPLAPLRSLGALASAPNKGRLQGSSKEAQHNLLRLTIPLRVKGGGKGRPPAPVPFWL